MSKNRWVNNIKKNYLGESTDNAKERREAHLGRDEISMVLLLDSRVEI